MRRLRNCYGKCYTPIIFSGKLYFWFPWINGKMCNTSRGSAWPVERVHLLVNITPAVIQPLLRRLSRRAMIGRKMATSYPGISRLVVPSILSFDCFHWAIQILKLGLKFSTSRFTGISGFSLNERELLTWTRDLARMGRWDILRFSLTTWSDYFGDPDEDRTITYNDS
jgi:hypothetical protein